MDQHFRTLLNGTNKQKLITIRQASVSICGRPKLTLSTDPCEKWLEMVKTGLCRIPVLPHLF